MQYNNLVTRETRKELFRMEVFKKEERNGREILCGGHWWCHCWI